MAEKPAPSIFGIPLEVPFTEHKIVAALGAQWAWWLKRWYVPENLDPRSFRRWLTRAAEERGPIDLSTVLIPPSDES